MVAEDISVYEQLARTKRSSGYTQHILSERECKLALYHETMDRLIREWAAGASRSGGFADLAAVGAVCVPDAGGVTAHSIAAVLVSIVPWAHWAAVRQR